ncbi:MAG: ATP-NAD kinase family protein [Bacteroidetes bacterium]|nr:ATP-NAD kinase family protein [Bacteroidota bacterium]
MKVGLIINPIAGMGGSVGLKGTDGEEILKRARELGAEESANYRTLETLRELKKVDSEFTLCTPSGKMGETAAIQCGYNPNVVYRINKTSSCKDTMEAAKTLIQKGVDILLFAGGDGTARDIYSAIGDTCVVLGIPCGVKMHSGVYASHPITAAEIVTSYLKSESKQIVEAEVIDLDEEAYRSDQIATKLYGYLKIPLAPRLTQGVKSRSQASDTNIQRAIAKHVIKYMEEDCFYLIGPGSTTRTVMNELKLPNTLLGVDLIKNRKLIGLDLSEEGIINLIGNSKTKVVVTPIGGQGFIFGRGNQQISPTILRQIGKGNIIIVATQSKLYSLGGIPLRVDTGDIGIDNLLSGYYKIITGLNETVVYNAGV